MSEEIIKKVFISYSWTTPKHEIWVEELGKKLTEDGVEVILDKWDLKEGQDKFTFMEKMITDNSIDKVLIICDKGYKEKADGRAGGVGTETQIITPSLYNQAQQTKFIPIIVEEGEKGFDDYMPCYLKSRIGIKMSSPDSYMDGYERLLRIIYEKPMHKKPKRGNMPHFLKEESKVTSALHNTNESLKNYVKNNNQSMIKSTYFDFKDKFFNELDNFIIDNDKFIEPYDEQIIQYIDDMKEIRDEFLIFIENLICGYDEFNEDIIIEFFEKLYSYSEYKRSDISYSIYITDHFKFFITELFLWVNMLLLKYEKFDIMKEILHTKYFFKNKFHHGADKFVNLRFYLDSFDYRKKRLNLNNLSSMADKLVDRTNFNHKSYKENLINTDLILYYISKTQDEKHYWFPMTYIYKEYNSKIDFLTKMVRKKHFDKIKIIFNVETKEEMLNIINNKLSNSDNGFLGCFFNIPVIFQSIRPEEIATV